MPIYSWNSTSGKKKYTETPWGPSSDAETEKLAEGIILHSTSSHGGIYLSPERQSVIKKKFPKFQTFVGGGEWFEEDCDVAVVMVAFPEAFKPTSVEAATKMILHDFKYFQITAEELGLQPA